MENWLPVVGFEGLYEVSDRGRVRGVSRKIQYLQAGFRPATLRHKGRVLSLFIDRQGYKRANINLAKVGNYSKLVHRLVAEAFIPNPMNKSEVNHIDNIKGNNRVANLEWVTRKENQQHAESIGAVPHCTGENHHNSKLTQADVDLIRKKLASGIPGVKLASEFGVCQSNISTIKYNRGWKEKTTPKGRS